MEIASDVWVAALERPIELAGGFATIARKGDARSGAVLVKTFDPKTREARIYEQAFAQDGETVWMRPLPSAIESDVDAYAQRAARVDPDLWVVEIEAADGARFLTERVEG
jgi:hypothetical protein